MSKKSQPGKVRKSGKPQRQPATPSASPEVLEVVRSLQQLARESPEGWGTIAQVLKQQPDLDADALLQFLALNLGKEVLPLLRGAALDEGEELALAALGALPLLGTRAAGEVLVEAFRAHPEGERGKLAWQAVEALQARGINVSVPKPEGVAGSVPEYTLRDTWESFSDGVGSRETIARLQDRYGVWHSSIVLWNDQAGVKDGLFVPMSRREWDELQERNRAEGEPLVPVPADFARWQIQQARGINATSGFPLDDHLEEWERRVGPVPEAYAPEDPLAAPRALPEAQRAELAQHLSCLLHEGLFSTWALEPADLQPWLERWSELMEQLEDGDEADAEAADRELDGLCAEAVRKLVTPELAELWRQRLVDAARKLKWLGMEHEATIAAAVALQIESAAEPAQVPFFQELVDTSLNALADFTEAGEDPEALRYDPMAPVEELPERG